MIEVSARHVHLTQEHVDILFGDGTVLEPRKELTQPGLFACKQRVDLVGPRGTIQGVTILGPVRKYTQVELSKTDARVLGLTPPVRESGNLEETPGCTLVGSVGSIDLEYGVIIARRHIHMNSADAERYGVQSGDCVNIAVADEDGRALIFQDVLSRVSPKVSTFVHIDTDEGNAAGIIGKTYGGIVKLEGD